jgi:hypothetical protein
MSKKIADLNLDDSEFLNDSLMDFYNDSDTVDPLDEQEESITEETTTNFFEDTAQEDTTLDSKYDDEEEVEITDNTNIEDRPVGPPEPESLDNYNTLALLALSLQEEDPDLIDFEIDKDIKPEALINNLKTKINNTREEVSREVEEKYEGAARYLKLLLEGGTDQEVKTALSYNQIASLNITGNEEESVLEQAVLSWLNLKGSPDAADLIDVYKDKGILADKAKEAVEFHKEQEAVFFQQWQQNRDTQIAQSQKAQIEYQKAVQSQINKGVVKGLAIKDKKKFEESLFKPTEIVEYIDDSGKKRLQKVPLINIKMQEFQQDLEQQLALQLLLLDGFDFTSLVDKAKRKVSSNLINTLNERTTAQNTNGRRSSSTYFED